MGAEVTDELLARVEEVKRQLESANRDLHRGQRQQFDQASSALVQSVLTLNRVCEALREERARFNRLCSLVRSVVPYVQATLPMQPSKGTPDWGAAHMGRSRSSSRQLERLLRKIEEESGS